MDIARDLVLQMKQKNKSHVGYGLQGESEALVGHILQNMAKSPMPSLKSERKNEQDSTKYREEGNQHFVAGDDRDAVDSYTRALAYANSKEQMAYAHANRSAALYRLKMYKECLIDVQTALELDYPEDKRQKLRERGSKAMERVTEALAEVKIEESREAATSPSADSNPCPFGSVENSPSKKFPLISHAEEENPEKSLDKKEATGSFVKPRYLLNPEVMAQPYGPSEEAPAISRGVRISFSQEYGRHLVATKEFKPGDILTTEEPYCWVIYQDKFYTHCFYCLERCYCLIPCPHCPLALFCSDKCRTSNWKLAHRTECPVLAILVNLLHVEEDKIRMVMKIIRLLITATGDGKMIFNLKKEMEIAESNPDDRTAGFTDLGMLESQSARSALSLATNMTTRPLIGISAFACISALAAMLLATQTKFFSRKYQLPELQNLSPLPEVKFCAGLMLRACVITSSNCFSVQPEPGVKSGSGLFVAHSLYNHSCAPNTFRHFEGLKMITRAMEPIYPGNQVFTGYGADYSYMPKAKRKAKLMEEYLFDCQCAACVNDWPTYQEILDKHVGSITKNKKLVERLKPYKQRLLSNKYDVEAVKEVIAILHKEVKKPCEEILHAVQYLRSYYLGKLHKSL